MSIKVERHPGAGICTGGIGLSEDIAWPLGLPAALVSISVGIVTILLSRDEAADVAEGLRSCLLDS